MYSYRFAVQHSSKFFEVSSVCLGTFSDWCDQITCKLTKHCSVVGASYRATTYCYLKCIVYDKLLKPRQSFLITLYNIKIHF